jgi:predicted phage tail protein
MSLDPLSLFLGFVIGGIGFVLFIYGKKQDRLPQLIGGVLFMVYPYFVPDALWMTVVAAVLGVAIWMVVRLGY